MKEKEHWLVGLDRVLNAETGDLKKLAIIAGEDPATLFIGTSLDGADLRGQDLRGMQFTHLDLGRLQHDSQTQMDVKVDLLGAETDSSGDDALLQEVSIIAQLSDTDIVKFASMQRGQWMEALRLVIPIDRYRGLDKLVPRPPIETTVFSVGVQAAGARMKMSREIDIVEALPDQGIAKLALLRGEVFVAVLQHRISKDRFEKVQQLISERN